MREMGNKGKPEPVIDAAIYPFADALPPARPMLETRGSVPASAGCPDLRYSRQADDKGALSTQSGANRSIGFF